ncbi:RHS repeat-associated core domain-containing protein [Pseudomonas japonica]|uniref:RHS repeat-associated core domain-containing protein n=1 Tax=Pseudomonas japonica TaxID=256466 RepID=A0A239B272_9PSED|nr:RHS repeat-associated core domain-containing protein [Pseudomonas japonica]SNS02056.1 RHS repeat-associated core domain-containing protein [Pseudomonas japonica]
MIWTLLLACDQQQSVLRAGSDAVVYTPHGHHASLFRAELPAFNGELPEWRTGHYLLGNGYRVYNPVLMRFHSPDSWSPFGRGGLNAYAFCLGDPVNLLDPDGHAPLSGFLAGLRKFFGRVLRRRASEGGEGGRRMLPARSPAPSQRGAATRGSGDASSSRARLPGVFRGLLRRRKVKPQRKYSAMEVAIFLDRQRSMRSISPAETTPRGPTPFGLPEQTLGKIDSQHGPTMPWDKHDDPSAVVDMATRLREFRRGMGSS